MSTDTRTTHHNALKQYLHATEKDGDLDRAAALRMMAAKAPEVARHVGCTAKAVVDWCDTMSVD